MSNQEVYETGLYPSSSDEDDSDIPRSDLKIRIEKISDCSDGQRNTSANATLFTPFNMKEELEEGHFDQGGFYHWKKKPKMYDYWLDNIDKYKIEVQNESKDSPTVINESISNSAMPCNFTETYKTILSYLQPGETVSNALSRLGRKNTLSTLQRFKLKKLGHSVDSSNAQKIMALTGLVNCIVSKTGNFDIYQSTHDDISNIIHNVDSNCLEKDEATSLSLENTAPKHNMFSDDFFEEEKTNVSPKYSVRLK